MISLRPLLYGSPEYRELLTHAERRYPGNAMAVDMLLSDRQRAGLGALHRRAWGRSFRGEVSNSKELHHFTDLDMPLVEWSMRRRYEPRESFDIPPLPRIPWTVNEDLPPPRIQRTGAVNAGRVLRFEDRDLRTQRGRDEAAWMLRKARRQLREEVEIQRRQK